MSTSVRRRAARSPGVGDRAGRGATPCGDRGGVGSGAAIGAGFLWWLRLSGGAASSSSTRGSAVYTGGEPAAPSVLAAVASCSARGRLRALRRTPVEWTSACATFLDEVTSALAIVALPAALVLLA